MIVVGVVLFGSVSYGGVLVFCWDLYGFGVLLVVVRLGFLF